MLGEGCPLVRRCNCTFSLPLFPVWHDKNTRSRLLPKTTSFPPGGETAGPCPGWLPLPHTVQEISRRAGSGGSPGRHDPEGSGAMESGPAWQLRPPAPSKAAFLRKAQEMYVRAILGVHLPPGPSCQHGEGFRCSSEQHLHEVELTDRLCYICVMILWSVCSLRTTFHGGWTDHGRFFV